MERFPVFLLIATQIWFIADTLLLLFLNGLITHVLIVIGEGTVILFECYCIEEAILFWENIYELICYKIIFLIIVIGLLFKLFF